MSRLFYNGYAAARLIVKSSGVTIATINLPQCGIKGAPEEYGQDFIEHTLDYKAKIVRQNNGRRILFTLDFTECASKSLGLEEIIQAIRYEDGNFQLFLIPHTDAAIRQYEVIGQNEKLNINLINNGDYSEGHQGFILQYKTIELIDDAFGQWVDIDSISIPLTNFII